ncbi:hypothetical protein ABPG75_012899 [Micractinium tetrahymenae]
MADQAFTCSQCKARLVLAGGEEGLRLSGSRSEGSGLSAKLEASFLLLEEASTGRGQPAAHAGGPTTAAGRRLDESFVVLPGGPGAAQSALLEGGPGGSGGSSGGSGSSAVQRIPFDAKLRALARVFEAASEATKVDFPLCAECAAEVHRELEAQLAELQQEVAAYEAALSRLEAEGPRPLEERAFQARLAEAEAEAQRERDRLAAAERELAAAHAELARVQARSAELSGQEERHWQAFNEFQLRLAEHLDERDALAHRLEASSAALAALKRTTVIADTFRIWFDGSCGTISGLRLGRTAQQAVEWEEINAAWGQAVLLLATLAKACGVRFRAYRLLPQGSYPQVADARGGAAYDLHGPVSKFLCHSYDKAQVGFLTCLKEFADWLVARGASDGQGNRFALPCPIEGDKVNGLTIRLMFNKDKNWTRALKHMLVDLKFVLKFALAVMDTAQLPAAGGHSGQAAMAALAREDPAGQ